MSRDLRASRSIWVESGQGIAKSSNCLSYPNANKDSTELVDKKTRDNSECYPSKQTLDTLFPLETLPLKPSWHVAPSSYASASMTPTQPFAQVRNEPRRNAGISFVGSAKLLVHFRSSETAKRPYITSNTGNIASVSSVGH